MILNDRSKSLDLSEMTYQHFEDVDLVNEGGIVLHLLLLDCLNGELLSTFTVLC